MSNGTGGKTFELYLKGRQILTGLLLLGIIVAGLRKLLEK